MNNYIIDPSVFYWINVLAIIQTVTAVIGGASLVASIGFAITYFCTLNDLDPEPKKPEEPTLLNGQGPLPDTYNQHLQERYNQDLWEYERDMKRRENDLGNLRTYKKWMLFFLIPGLIFVLISIFVPGKTTSVEMLVAKTATFDNVNWTVQQVKEIIDYIVVSLKGAV